MSRRHYTVVDVFTDTPLEGNPTAIFSDGQGLSTEVMQRTAREFNPTREPFEQADELLAALGVERSELPIQAYRNGPVHVYVALRD